MASISHFWQRRALVSDTWSALTEKARSGYDSVPLWTERLSIVLNLYRQIVEVYPSGPATRQVKLMRRDANMRLNARQKREIESHIRAAQLDPFLFEFKPRESECVSVYVQHGFQAADGHEPTTAESVSYRANPEYFFTFERNHSGRFYATAYPELEIGRNIGARDWPDLLSGFKEWLGIFKAQIEIDGEDPPTSREFMDFILVRDYQQIRNEFLRAEQTCASDPPAAVVAASSMVESACKLYIDDHGLKMPSKLTIKPLWSTVANDLLPSPASIADDDTKKIISGMASVVEGLGSLRTHAGSAHGRGRSDPQIGVAEAFLAINGAQAMVLYMIQKWGET